MIKRILYLFIYLSIYLSVRGQVNLVPNYSFEDTVGGNCWMQMGLQNSFANNFKRPKNWYTYKYMSLEYHNTCANNISGNPPPNHSSIPYSCEGHQYPRTGNSYIGGILHYNWQLPDTVNIYTELAVVKLKQSLKINTCYYGEFYYNFADINKMSINQLGMLLTQFNDTTTSFVLDNTTKYQIQADTNAFLGDTLNWVKISGYFVAQGNEEYLTIGNIRDGAHLKKSHVANTYTTPCQFGFSERQVYIYI